MYKLTDNIEAELKAKITPKSLKIYKDLGLLNRGEALSQDEFSLIKSVIQSALDEDFDRDKAREAMKILDSEPAGNEIELYLDPEKLKMLIDVTFDKNVEDVQDVDISAVVQGVYDQMGKLNPSLAKSIGLSELLSTLTQTAQKNQTP